jgi:hypothetical protein
LLLVASVPALAQEDADPFATAAAAVEAPEYDPARVAIVREFLADHPDHPDAPVVVRVGADLLAGPLDDRDGAIALAKAQLTRTADARAVSQIQDVLMDLYGHPGYGDRLATLVAERYDAQTMGFVDHLAVIRAATAAEAWDLVDAHCAAARPRANAETFAADYPDREFTADHIAAAGRHRQGLLDTYAGWSRARQNRLPDALAAFERASGLLRRTFLGVPEGELYRYWGAALVSVGETDAGLEKLTLAGIFGHDGEALERARAAFIEHRPDDDFASYVWRQRLHHAPAMADFTAVDYSDQPRRFAEMRGRKATLVAFWFPT